MTRYFSGILLFFFMLQNLYAQDLPKLTVPASPAFSILDFEPSAIMRPTNARSLAGDVLNSFDKDGKLLMNLGLEVAPYWLKSHPGLRRETYLSPNPGQAFLQSFSLSAATVKDSSSRENKLGAGFRFKLVNGKPLDNELKEVTTELRAKNTILDMINGARAQVGSTVKTRQDAINIIVANLGVAGIDSKVIATVKSQAEALQDNYTDSAEDIKNFLEKLTSDRTDAESELIKKKSELLYERRGFVLEFAGATSYNSSKKNILERFGFWGNASYYVSPDDFFTLTARYMFRNNDSSLINFDMGLGFLKKTSNYNISVEAMFRFYKAEIPDTNINNQPIKRVQKDFTYRLAVQGCYRITKDVSINLSLGKDFNSPFISGSSFFSILGFNYSIFSKEPAKLK